DGRLIDVTVERWGEHEREIVEHPGAVAIVAVDADGCLTLVRQLREAARARLLELPAGGPGEGGGPPATGTREAARGHRPEGGRGREVRTFYMTPGFCRERMTVFFAEGVEAGEAAPEADEDLELVRWPVDAIADRLDEVQDAKSLVGLLLYLRLRQGGR